MQIEHYACYEIVLADAKRAARYYLGWMDEDFAEDVTLQLLSKMPANASAGWHRVCIRHACLKAARRQSRHTSEFPLHATLPRLDRLFDLEAKLEKLSPDAQAMLYLWLAGFQSAQIAAQRRCSSSAVRSGLRYALRRLKH